MRRARSFPLFFGRPHCLGSIGIVQPSDYFSSLGFFVVHCSTILCEMTDIKRTKAIIVSFFSEAMIVCCSVQYTCIHGTFTEKGSTTMDRQKISKAFAASTLAVGSVAMVAPATYASVFTDVSETNSHYKSIIELYERGVISGYPQQNGTKQFKPNDSLTRAHAAKMLANAIGLSTQPENLRNPGFSDVPTSHAYYPYIAALANAGIISGYQDGTFRPGAQILRQQMAKILTLGYGLDKSTKLNHHFTDVSNNTESAYYIQTLWDYDITKGNSPTTFGPTKNLTRGQMATFIVRTEEVAKTISVQHTITSVPSTGTVIINGNSYTVDPKFNMLFSTANAAALKGAVIEGRVSNGKVQDITKLVLKASGNARTNVVLDAKSLTLDADLEIQSNHIIVRNLHVNGTISVPSTDLRRLTSSIVENQLTRYTSASVANDYGIRTTSTILTNVSRNIKFENVTSNKMVVAQNRLKFESDSEIRRLELIDDVEQIEIHANVRDVYVYTNGSTAIYGKSQVRTLTKENFGNLMLYFTGIVNRYIVNKDEGGTNLATTVDSNGKAAQGFDLWIDTAVLTNNENPNIIFNDYRNDSANISLIVDKDGNEIDKTVDENTLVPDRIAPLLTGLRVIPTDSHSAKVDFNSNEAGKYYYVLLESSQSAPTKRQILSQSVGDFQGTGGMMEGANSFNMTGLHSAKEYTIYMVIEDNAGNTSTRVESFTFDMKDAPDTIPPRISNVKVEPHQSGQKARLTFTATEAGMFYIVVTEGHGNKGYEAQTIINISMNDTTKYKEMVEGENTIEMEGLDPLTDYSVALVGVDTAENRSSVTETPFTTLALDDVKPYVMDSKIVFTNSARTQFYLYFSEELNQETAENVLNYELTGSGIINITGQEKINPIKAEYSRHSSGTSRVLITLPALTGLVQNDTIIARALPGVTDLADNPVVTDKDEDNPRNYASYRHEDVVIPSLTVTSFEKLESETHAKLMLNTTEAGTFYYVILPEGLDVQMLNDHKRDIMDRVPFEVKDAQDITRTPIYPGDNPPLDLGEQQLDIAIPTTLSELISWSMYAFMVDRSGNLSANVIEIPMIMDKLPPSITAVSANAEPGSNTAGRLNFASDELGVIEYIAFPTNATGLPNGGELTSREQFEAVKTLTNISGMVTGSAGMIRTDNRILIEGLQPHTDYTVYFIARDTSQNTTPNLHKAELYTDGIKPELNPILVRQLDDISYVLTFSEAIKRDTADDIIPLTTDDFIVRLNDGRIVVPTTVETQTSPTTPTYNPYEVKLTFAEQFSQDFTVTMNESVVDSVKVNHVFEEAVQKGDYKFQDFRPNIELVELVRDTHYEVSSNPDANGLYLEQSKTIKVNYTANYNAYNVKYYFIGIARGQEGNITPPTKLDVMLGETNPNYTVYGSGDSPSTSSSINMPVKSQDPTAVFMNEGTIYLVLQDQYGNTSNVIVNRILGIDPRNVGRQ